MKNEGKRFEEDFKKSVPKECWYYRLKDAASSFGKTEGLRFSSSNIADCLVMSDEFLFILELKSHKGTSLPFNCIRKNQIDQMSNVEHKKIKPYFIINFRSKEKTYAVEAKRLKEFMETTDRKSIPIVWCEENGLEIEGIKKRTRYEYELNIFFNEASKIS